MAAELKPCPFCGGEAELYITNHVPAGKDYTQDAKNPSCCGRLTKKFTSIETAFVFWNRRAENG